MYRFKSKNLYLELLDLDYLKRLSDKDKEWLIQFMFEYYQADFNFDNPIHPKELRKDCMNRNNSSKRQIHSVGPEILEEAIKKARSFQNKKGMAHLFYVPEDYNKEHEDNSDVIEIEEDN